MWFLILHYSQKWLVVLGKASGKGSKIIALVDTGNEILFRGYRLLWSLTLKTSKEFETSFLEEHS